MKKKTQYYFNRRASFDYVLYEREEAGIELKENDYPQICKGAFDATKSFVWFYGKEKREMYWVNLVINGLTKKRKLLMNRHEIDSWYKKSKQKKTTIIVLQIYKKNGKFKLEIAQAKRKQKWEKKQILKEKELDKEIKSAHKYFVKNL